MYENDYMYAIERNDQYLAHYGIRGMKWGVRKAIASGNSARLGRQYAKAQKKLAKLEKRAANSKKYARRAALLGAGAAAAGGLAAAGTEGVSKLLRGGSGIARKGLRGVGAGLNSLGNAAGLAASRAGNMSHRSRAILGRSAAALTSAGNAVTNAGATVGRAGRAAGSAVGAWGKTNSLGRGIQKQAGVIAGRTFKGKNAAFNIASRDAARNATSGIAKLSNNTIARIGAGAVGAGLAVGAAKNAYRAATAKKKAEKFRSAMNEAFKGTQYANGGRPRQGKKRRR